MDCGPAALACLLRGFGVEADYGRLREACQTDVDGTSIDTLEDAAVALGLDARQVMLPADTLLDPESEALPAIVVMRLPNGFTHFVVAWRRHRGWVQVMDPAVGRRFVRARRFVAETYQHAMPVPADLWEGFARSDGFARVVSMRLRRLGLAETPWSLVPCR
jgi:ABC-type bacteriocin/lantibiotic exporter with double-glycine peptidase domain